MQYRVIRSEDREDSFEHALFGGGRQKGAQNKNHKYLARAWIQAKWRYAYTPEEVRQLQNWGKGRLNNLKDKAKEAGEKVSSTAKKASDIATGKYAKAVDSKADRYAESAAKKSAASQRQSSEASSKRTQATTAKIAAQYDTQNAGKLGNIITGKSKMYKEAANTNAEASKKANAEASRLSSLSTKNAMGARSDAVKAKAAEAEKETAAYKVSKASSKAQNAIANTSNKVSKAVNDAPDNIKSAAEKGKTKAEEILKKASNTAKSLPGKASDALDKAKDVATGKYAKDVDRNIAKAKETEERAREAFDKEYEKSWQATGRALDNVFDNSPEANRRFANATDSSFRSSLNMDHYAKLAQESEVEQFKGIRDKQTDAYKISKAVNDTKDKVSETAKKTGDAVKSATEKAISNSKSTADKGKAKVEELFGKASSAVKTAAKKVSDAANDVDTAIYNAKIDAHNKKAAKNSMDSYKEKYNNSREKLADAAEKYGVGSSEYIQARDTYERAANNLMDNARKAGKSEEGWKQLSENNSKYDALGRRKEQKIEIPEQKVEEVRIPEKKIEETKIQEKFVSDVKTAADKGKSKVEELFGKASATAKTAASKAESMLENIRDIPENIKDSVNEKRNYHNKVDAKRQSGIDEYEERSKIHSENYNKYWDPNSTEAQRIVADKALNDNWKPMWDAQDRYSEAERSQRTKKYADSEELDRKLTKAENAVENTKKKVKDTATKVYDEATDAIERVRESDAMAYVNKATDKISNAVERATDKVSDAKANAEHKAYANEMKRKYGADSLHYKDAQAYVEHDETVDELRKARDKYGVGSAEYKSASIKERSAREKMNEVHEQNLYANNKEYKKISDQAGSLLSYIANMDARGGPQSAEGKANYRKAIQDLNKLEAQLDRMWNEDWE